MHVHGEFAESVKVLVGAARETRGWGQGRDKCVTNGAGAWIVNGIGCFKTAEHVTHE